MAAPTAADAIGQANRRKFLAAFAVCGSIVKAARWAHISRQTHYDWMEDPTYRAAFEEAWKRAADALEAEAVRRAHDGIRKAVRYKGRVVGYETEFSDTLLLALLKAKKSNEYRDKSTIEHHGSTEKPPLAVNIIYTEK
jgi:hypothetical protein